MNIIWHFSHFVFLIYAIFLENTCSFMVSDTIVYTYVLLPLCIYVTDSLLSSSLYKLMHPPLSFHIVTMKLIFRIELIFLSTLLCFSFYWLLPVFLSQDVSHKHSYLENGSLVLQYISPNHLDTMVLLERIYLYCVFSYLWIEIDVAPGK